MERTVKKKMLSIVLAAMMCLMSTGAFAADLAVERWNATITTFIAQLSGEASEVAVTVDGKAATVTTANAGGKTTVTAALDGKLALDTFYPVKVTAGGQTVYDKEIKLQKLLEDDFDSYADNKATSAVYKGSNGNTAADAVDGKLRVRNVYDQGTVYHKDLGSAHKDWRDYTLEVDYIPGGDGSNTPATQAFIYMEAHPAAVDDGNMKFGNLYKMSTASATIRANDMQVSCANNGATGDGFDYKNLIDVTSGAATAQNVQISTKDGHAMILADKKGGGKVVQDFTIRAGVPRGGGFAFTARNAHYYLDNLKVYKAVEQEQDPVELAVERWNMTTTAFTATLSGEASDVAVTVGGKAATVETANAGGKTTITAALDGKLALDTFYPVQVTAGGQTVYDKEIKLQKLLEDDFDGYADNKAISAVYKGSNGNTAADAVDGKLRVRNVYDQGTVYHKDLGTAQQDWQDYTLDVDYIPGGDGSNTPANQAFIYMESHPAAVDDGNMKFGNLYKMSTASATIRSGDMQTSCANNGATGDGFDYKNLTGVTDGAATAQNVQISTKDGHAMILADKKGGGGKVVQDFTIRAGVPRGGGFAFAARNAHYYLDNLKVYKAVEQDHVVDPPDGPGKVYDISYWNATTTAAYVTLDGEAAGTITVKNAIEGDAELKVEKKVGGGKTELVILPDKPFEMGQEYSLRIFENSTESAVLRFKLLQMYEDNFDSYRDDKEIRAVYPGSNSSTVAEIVDGKMRVRNVYLEGTLVHKDFETVQKDWQDYTIDVDYIPGGSGSNAVATQAFFYMEAHPAQVDGGNLKFENLRKNSTAAENIMAEFVQAFLGKGDSYDFVNLTGVTDGAATAQNVQISTKDGHAMILADKKGGGKVVQDFTIPAGAPRGGGFAFTVRNAHYYLDNLKVYKAVPVPEHRGAMTLEGESITAKNAAFTFSDDVSRFQGNKITLNKYENGEIKPVPFRVEANGTKLDIVPDAALAGGNYLLKLEQGITSADDSKETEHDITRFFRVAGSDISPVANWSSDPAYGSSQMFDGAITFTFEQSLDVPTITADSVKVYKNGAEISGTTVSATEKTVTVNLNEEAEFDTKYEVRFTGQAKLTGNYGFPELTFFVPNGLNLTGFEVTLRDQVIHPSTPIGGETIRISATIASNETTKNRSVMVTFCVFDADGRMCRIGGEKTTVAAGASKDVYANMVIPAGSGYTIKCFVWDSFENLIGIHEEIWR